MRAWFTLMVVSMISLVVSCDKEAGEATKDYYIKYYGVDGDDQAADMVVNADGTIVLLGTSQLASERRLYLVKVDEAGEVMWEKTFGDFDESAQDIEPITAGLYAGGYLVLSNIMDDEGNTIIKVVRTDEEGEPIDSLIFDDYATQFAHSVTSLSDGGFVFTGNTTENLTSEPPASLPDQTDLLNLRFNESMIMDPVWLKSFGSGPEIMGVKILEISPTQFYFAGYTNATHDGEPDVAANYDFDFLYVKLNGQGSNSGDLYSGSSVQDKMNSITKTLFGDYFSVGTVTQSNGDQQIFVSRVNGNFTTEDPYPVADFDAEGVSVAASGISEILILGNKITTGGSRDIMLFKMNRDFGTEPGFPKSFGSAGNDDTASAVAELPNGDVIILGTMNLVNQKKIALIRLKGNGGF